METCNNYIRLCGEIAAAPRFSHMGKYEKFYTFPMDIKRLSGNVDTINVIIPEKLMHTELSDTGRYAVTGEIHSYNNKSGVGNRLMISVLASSMEPSDGEDANETELYGTLCKKPNFRVTPMGREICDMMVAVNRRRGKSDYLPCIAWGRLARLSDKWDVGQNVHIIGRIQSRHYIKTGENTREEKTAYEISAAVIEETELPNIEDKPR